MPRSSGRARRDRMSSAAARIGAEIPLGGCNVACGGG